MKVTERESNREREGEIESNRERGGREREREKGCISVDKGEQNKQ